MTWIISAQLRMHKQRRFWKKQEDFLKLTIFFILKSNCILTKVFTITKVAVTRKQKSRIFFFCFKDWPGTLNKKNQNTFLHSIDQPERVSKKKIKKFFVDTEKQISQIFLYFYHEIEISKFSYSYAKTEVFQFFMLHGTTWDTPKNIL